MYWISKINRTRELDKNQKGACLRTQSADRVIFREVKFYPTPCMSNAVSRAAVLKEEWLNTRVLSW